MAKKSIPGKVLKLKPGRHQFVPGVNSFHTNENTSEAELKWYLERFPHIKDMLVDEPRTEDTEAK